LTPQIEQCWAAKQHKSAISHLPTFK